MIPQDTIDAVKAVAITDYLASRGVAPVKRVGPELYYCSPLSGEKTPSFAVDPVANVFCDWSSGERGDVLRLVRALEKVSFAQAVDFLLRFNGPAFSFSGQPSPPAPPTPYVKKQPVVTGVAELHHPALLRYIVQERGVSLRLARMYCKEVYYSRDNFEYFGVGFQARSGGWAVRSERLKTWIGSGDVTVLPRNGAYDYAVIFEGFFSFLSALQYFNVPAFKGTVIVLNSAAYLSKVSAELGAFSKIYCALDNDETGYKALAKVQALNENVVDWAAKYYPAHGDFNDLIRTDVGRAV